jgi:hypothetical protein
MNINVRLKVQNLCLPTNHDSAKPMPHQHLMSSHVNANHATYVRLFADSRLGVVQFEVCVST